MSKVLRVALASLLLVGVFSSGAAANGRDVQYTWVFSALGQGGWVGGPLYSDGSAGGGGAFSAADGQLIALLDPVSWTQVDPATVEICFTATAIKGAGLPPTLCIALPVTGTPIVVPVFGTDHVIRVTPAG